MFWKKIDLLSARPYQSIPMQKIVALAVLTLCTSSTFVVGAADTPETRRREGERYLQATPPKALFEDIANNMAANLPPADREKFKQLNFAARRRGANQGDD
jgi:hypothetical protein